MGVSIFLENLGLSTKVSGMGREIQKSEEQTYRRTENRFQYGASRENWKRV
jgi:hypothetical protein